MRLARIGYLTALLIVSGVMPAHAQVFLNRFGELEAAPKAPAFAVALASQAPTPVVTPGQTILIAFDHYANRTDIVIAALVDGAIVKNFTEAELAAPLVNNQHQIAIPAVARGRHRLKLRATSTLSGLFGETAELEFVSDTTPAAPGMPSIIIRPGGGPGEIVIEVQGFTSQTQVLRIPSGGAQ